MAIINELAPPTSKDADEFSYIQTFRLDCRLIFESANEIAITALHSFCCLIYDIRPAAWNYNCCMIILQ